MKKIFSLLFFAVMVFYSCDNDDTNTAPGTLNLTFENVVGSQLLELGETYTNISGESYTVTELKYIISNITLTRKDGTLFIYPVDQSYFVINEEEENSLKVALEDIPAGSYTQATFGFGVDPTKYPIESGTLNFVPTAEEAGMLWTWSAGYKFIKLEGMYTPENSTEEAPFTVHVGSHGANLDNYKEVTVSLGDDIANTDFLVGGATPEANQTIFFNVGNVFDGQNTIRIEDKPDIQVDPINAPKITQNISTSFFIPQG